MAVELLHKQIQGFLATPPLWLNEQFGIRQFEFPGIKTEGLSYNKLPSNIRLGHQMEYVFKQLLEHAPNYRLLLHNLPIKNGNRTIGEIDFILRNLELQQTIHVELTYKFYIIHTEMSEPVHQLMGPNKRDMFFTKMEKIRNGQFPLLHSNEGAAALGAKGIDHREITHQACYKAQLFRPFDTESVHIRPLNHDCITGFWLRFDDFNSREFQQNSYYVPYKVEWVIAPHTDVPWCSHFELLLELNLRMLKENAPMVWMKKPDDTFEKFFVVWW